MDLSAAVKLAWSLSLAADVAAAVAFRQLLARAKQRRGAKARWLRVR